MAQDVVLHLTFDLNRHPHTPTSKHIAILQLYHQSLTSNAFLVASLPRTQPNPSSRILPS